MAEVDTRLQEVEFPLGYHAEVLGEFAERQAAQNRLLLFAIAAAIGVFLILLASFGNIPGAEIEYPMAIVILGGLITSTLLNLFVVPSLYLRFGRQRHVLSSRRAVVIPGGA